jgi:hypothetical protein
MGACKSIARDAATAADQMRADKRETGSTGAPLLQPIAWPPWQQLKGYRIFIFSHDHPHPPHVHFGKRKRFSSWDLVLLTCVSKDGFWSREIDREKVDREKVTSTVSA